MVKLSRRSFTTLLQPFCW